MEWYKPKKKDKIKFIQPEKLEPYRYHYIHIIDKNTGEICKPSCFICEIIEEQKLLEIYKNYIKEEYKTGRKLTDWRFN